MKIALDSDIQIVAEFMQRNIAAHKLASVANGVAVLAPVLWGHYCDRRSTDNGLPILALEETPPPIA